MLASVLFAFIVVGGIAITTYVIVSDGMQAVAYDTTARVGRTGSTLVREAASEAELKAATEGFDDEARTRAAFETLVERLPELLGGGALAGAQFVLYDENLDLVWSSEGASANAAFADERRLALETGQVVRSAGERGSLFAGLFGDAELAGTVVHAPVSLPGGRAGVLDVDYEPLTEEQVIDAVRVPMGVLAVSAMIIMVVLMQSSMAWVLNLVDDLRKAADSIDAGRLDERLPETGDNEIGDLARSLNRLLERLQRRSEAQTRFVADASHELATPVAGIRGYTNILRAWGAEDPKVRDEAIDAIDRESRRMARLTSDLLNLLHADQGLRLKAEKFDLNALVRERLATTASRYLDKDIEFVGPERESLTMVGDPDRAEDVLSILLDNAAKYTPEGGRVAVATDRHREEVLIEVSDTGRGIPSEEVPRVFDRFFRSEAARAGGEAGFGLGLAIAKGIVEQMGGRIEARSVLGEGTTFSIRVPRGRL